jgi:uncharacterized Zn-finger protein
MLDTNGREIKVGDWVATPHRLEDCPTAKAVARLADTIGGAVLGQVVQIAEDFQGEFIHLGDGIIYGSEDIVTMGGLEFVTCPECGESWVFDVRMNTQEECPFCGHLFVWWLECLESSDWGDGTLSPEAELRKAALNRGRP